jgi:alkylhydroperoxidase family enzyme
MLAVVARALGCVYAEAECRRLLTAAGLGAADLDEILDTLASGRLDAREEKLVPFARETVRYQPGPIQTRIREVTSTLTPEETVEAVGIVSLGNALCRLSIVLDRC